MSRGWSCGVLSGVWVALLSMGCTVSIDTIPAEVRVTCDSDADCPAGLTCNPRSGVCQDAGSVDTDVDGVPDIADICPDGDDRLDLDQDGVPNDCDQCGGGDDRLDADDDDRPDACDACAGFDDGEDSDLDLMPDGCDVCDLGSDWRDLDADSVPDACDRCPGEADGVTDSDADTVPDACDLCAAHDDAVDTDNDGAPDGCDVCTTGNDSHDFDADGTPDGCDVCAGFADDENTDGDDFPDGCDPCPLIDNNSLPGDDPPDPVGVGAEFFDANCDGVDGNLATSFLVSGTGLDQPDRGTLQRPFRTIQYAVDRAAADATRKHVLIAEGLYEGQVVLADGVSLHGQYAAGFSQRGAEFTTSLVAHAAPTLDLVGSTSAAVVEGLTIRAETPALPGQAAMGMRAVDVTGPIVFRGVTLSAADGAAGADGDAGAPGLPGNPGQPAVAAGLISGPGAPGVLCALSPSKDPIFSGAGSSGGEPPTDGFPPSVASDSDPGSGPANCDVGLTAYNATPGGPSINSDAWAPEVLRPGEIADDFWKPKSGREIRSEFTGQPGAGGAGGCDSLPLSTASAGGGGGSGGCGGKPGKGGQGGGASIAAFLVNTASLVFIDVTFVAEDGGQGGVGGDGGPGGAGGAGGAPVTGALPGGQGGDGGKGGGAQGGPGGPSIGLLCVELDTACLAADVGAITVGAGGTGGLGGSNGDDAAPAGPSGAVSEVVIWETWTP